MSRPLFSLAAVFAVVIAAAAYLLYGADRGGKVDPGEQQQAVNAPASSPAEQPAGGSSAGTMTAQPSMESAPETATATASSSAAGNATPQSGQPEAATADAGGAPAEGGGGQDAPSFDIVRIEPTGEALIAGQAAPGSDVEILANGIVIARATADAEGAFLVMPAEALAAGEHQFALRQAGTTAEPEPEQRVAVIVPGETQGTPDGQAEQQVAMGQPATAPAESNATNPSAPGDSVAKAEPATPPSTPDESTLAAPAEQQAGAASAGAEPAVSEAPSGEASDVASASAQTPAAGDEQPSEGAQGPAVAAGPASPLAAPTAGSGTPSGRGNNGEPESAAKPGGAAGADEAVATAPAKSPVGEAPVSAGDEPQAPTVPQTEPDTQVAIAAPDASLIAGEPGGVGGQGQSVAASLSEPSAQASESGPQDPATVAQTEPDTQVVAPAPGASGEPAADAPAGGAAGSGSEIEQNLQAAAEPDAGAPAEAGAADQQPADAADAQPAAEAATAVAVAEQPPGPVASGLQPSDAAVEQPAAGGATVVATAEPPPASVPIAGAEGGAAPTGTASAEGVAEAPQPDLASGASTNISNGPPGDSGDIPGTLTIRAAEVEADTLYVAGEAAPGALVRVFANDEFVGEAAAGDAGAWLIEAPSEVPIGDVVIRADVADPNAAAPGEQVELPFRRFADGMVLEPVATASAEASAAFASMPSPVVLIIRRGDNLWRISRRNYGRGIRYEAIVSANRELIRNPDLIYPGQIFVMPSHDRSWETAIN